MKVRCIDNKNIIHGMLTIGEVYDVQAKNPFRYEIVDDLGRYIYFNKEIFEEVNEELEFAKEVVEACLKEKELREKNKTEKTFREVIADIKEGEVWECRSKYIKRFADGIQIYHKEKGKATPSMLMANNDKFKLQRKEVTFAEAFKAYEQGKGIESVVSNVQYQKELKDTVSIRPCYGEWFDANEKTLVFDYVEIKGKWYINN